MNQPESASTPRQQLGFTLSELLIIIAIVAVLAAILFPVFAQAREKAVLRHVGCQSNLRRIGDAFDQYLQDNDDTYPPALNDYRGGVDSPDPECPAAGCEYYVPAPGAPDPRQTWETSILPYLKHREFLACPEDPKAGYEGITRNDRYKGFPVSYSANGYLACYTGLDRYSGCYCRGVMCAITQGYYIEGAQMYPGKQYQESANSAITLSDVHHPEATVAVTETWSADVDTVDPNGNWTRFGDWNDIGGQGGNYPNYGDKVPCSIPNAGPTNLSTAFAVCGVNGAVSTHHGPGKDLANILFVDGHVAALSPPTTDPRPDAGNAGLPNGDTYDPNNQWDATRP